MASLPPQTPGHGRGMTSIRLQPAAYHQRPDGQVTVSYADYSNTYEVICPDCGDNLNVPYDAISPDLQQVRGPYQGIEEAKQALANHIGLVNVQWRTS